MFTFFTSRVFMQICEKLKNCKFIIQMIFMVSTTVHLSIIQ